MKIALGSVQFGLPYGVSNHGAQVGIDEVAKILELAQNSGIDTIDTAQAYGTAETVLGEVGIANFRVISKLPDMSRCSDPANEVPRMVVDSLARLKKEKLDGLLLHRSADLKRPQVISALDHLKQEGLCEKIGISIYEPRELDSCPAIDRLDIVQAPMNIFDQRIHISGWAKKLSAAGIEIHTRSAFLQGLLLMKPDARPPFFGRFTDEFKAWDARVQSTGNPVATALSVLLSDAAISRVVIGVDNCDQLQQILSAAAIADSDCTALPLGPDSGELIDPRTWRLE